MFHSVELLVRRSDKVRRIEGTCFARARISLPRTRMVFSTAATYKASAHTNKLRDGWPSLENSINHAFSGVRHWPVPFLQKFGQNWKVSYWI